MTNGDRVVALPRHKFVTGATLLQLPGSVHGHGQLVQLCFYFYEIGNPSFIQRTPSSSTALVIGQT